VRHLTLRWRLTLFYALLSSAILLVTGSVFFFSLRASLREMLDNSLHDAASLAASQLTGDEGQPKFSETDAESLQREVQGETTLVVFNTKQKQTDRLGRTRVTAPLEVGFTSTKGFRAYTVQTEKGDWVQALRSEVETLEALSRAQRLLLLTVPLMLLAGLGVGYLIADRALRPVDQVSRLASSIATSGRYKDRVPESPGDDEMTRLTQTVNAMLEKLEATIERERAFALAAAHELRTPLALLRGQTSLSLRRERTRDEYRQVIESVDQTSLEMTGLVESLLALARTNQTLQKQAVNLEDLVLEVLEVVESLSETARARSIKLILETQSAPTHGDPAALRLLVTNLVANAIKYGREGGHVWLRTSAQNDHAMLEVSDDGPGIEASDLERLTQPFQRGLGLQGVTGTGLGLALAVAVAEQHGGTLELSRAAEGGLRVIFRA
jgi:signal transduction histidine kinase